MVLLQKFFVLGGVSPQPNESKHKFSVFFDLRSFDVLKKMENHLFNGDEIIIDSNGCRHPLCVRRRDVHYSECGVWVHAPSSREEVIALSTLVRWERSGCNECV
jgi:hypothetical protein